MVNHLALLKSDSSVYEQQATAVADRYPQDVFTGYTHEFCELVIVWRGNGLHALNDRPYRITRGDLFYIHAEDKRSYTSVNDLALQNIICYPEWSTLDVDWQGAIPGFNGTPRQPHWRPGSVGMSQVRQVISQLEHESNQRNAQALTMAELLFGRLVIHLKRRRYATDTPPTASSETLLDGLITMLAGSYEYAFKLDTFCEREQCSERVLRQQFHSQTGMTINQCLRQAQVYYAQYLLKHSRLIINEISICCGFEDSNYFSVIFTREAGMTPSQWRHLSA